MSASPFPRTPRAAAGAKRLTVLLWVGLCLLAPRPQALHAQVKEHLLGIQGAYSLTGVSFNPDRKQETISTPKNLGLLYTYYHDLWGRIPIFGIQTGLAFCEGGYRSYGQTFRYQSVQLPLYSQFHLDFWNMRLLIDMGAYVGYRLGGTLTQANPEDETAMQTTDLVFTSYDNRWDYGFGGGGGLALKLKPIELQFQCKYEYSLGMLHNARKDSNQYYTYSHPHRLVFSLAVFVPLKVIRHEPKTDF